MPSPLVDLAAITVDAIDAFLPQTQCRRCRYESCRAYAEAVVAGQAAINRCPPGGVATGAAPAALLRRPALAIDPSCGVNPPLASPPTDDATMYRCTACLHAGPHGAVRVRS